MSKGKKFSAAEKYFQGIIDSKNKTIKVLTKSRDELLDEKYSLVKENEELKSKLLYAEKALEELSKLNDLSPEDIKVLVDKATNIKGVCDLLTGKITRELLGGY